jgi:hypothetical protein
VKIRPGPSALGLTKVELIEHVKKGEELLVHPDYLLAFNQAKGHTTRWLLSWSMPFTSIAAQLWLLKSIKNGMDSPQQVTISPTSLKDGLIKLRAIEIPAAGSMVIYPQRIVGILKAEGDQVIITRHWMLHKLHSWVTFQFRYLVIHGPGRIYVKGCQGVMVNLATNPSGQALRPEATLGFSVNLA